MKKIVLLMSLILIGISLGNKVDQITSPDKSLVLNVTEDNGSLYYSIYKNDKKVIDNSKLGIVSDKFEFSNNMIIENSSTNYEKSKQTLFHSASFSFFCFKFSFGRSCKKN